MRALHGMVKLVNGNYGWRQNVLDAVSIIGYVDRILFSVWIDDIFTTQHKCTFFYGKKRLRLTTTTVLFCLRFFWVTTRIKSKLFVQNILYIELYNRKPEIEKNFALFLPPRDSRQSANTTDLGKQKPNLNMISIFWLQLVGYTIASGGVSYSGGPSITGQVAPGHHQEITILQLYKVALSAGKAHRDHKHHHVHHFDHEGLVTQSPQSTPAPEVYYSLTFVHELHKISLLITV